MEIKDFNKEELVRAIVKFIRSGIHYNYANEYADALENGDWLEYFEEAESSWK